MSARMEDALPQMPEEPAPTPRGHAWLAWLVIATTVAFLVWLQTARSEGKAGNEPSGGLQDALFEAQARYFVGVNSMASADFAVTDENKEQADRKPPAPGAATKDSDEASGAEAKPQPAPPKEAPHNPQDLTSAIYAQSLALRPGPPEHRLKFVALAGELAGPEAALEQLADLREDLKQEQLAVEPPVAETQAALEKLYRDYAAGRWAAPAVSAAERQQIQRELGWFGRLALAPKSGPNQAQRQEILSSAQKTVSLLVGLFLLFVLLGLGGFIGLVVLFIFMLLGKLQHGFALRGEFGAIYAETFAVWIVLFLLLSLGASLVAPGPILWVQGLAMLLSLAALGWPVLRGVGWRRVREDIGLFAGKRPEWEPAIGLATYAMAIPLLVIGVILVVILILLTQQDPGGAANPFESPVQVSHPVVDELLHSGFAGWWQVLLLASVVAPLVEETMFRGVLYRHLREASTGWGCALSVLCSAMFTSFIFAVIHPQGVLAVPALMALALAFTLAREWRGSLVPCMVAHGVNNALVLTLLIVFLT